MAFKTTDAKIEKWERSGNMGKLIAALDERSEYIRENAAKALGRLNDPQAIWPLLESLKDRNEYVRVAAAKSLAAFGEPANKPLFNLLASDDEDTRLTALVALRELGDIVLVRLQSDILDRDYKVRRGAAFALGEFNDNFSIDLLLNALKDEAIQVRVEAALSLGKLRDSHAIPSLLIALNDNEPELKRSAAVALGEIGDDRAVPFLMENLADPEPSVRAVAAESLGMIGERSAIVSLITLLNDGDSQVSAAAVVALGQIGDNRAVLPLSNMLRDAVLRPFAVGALGKIGDITASVALLNIAAEADVNTRILIDKALRDIGMLEKYNEVLSIKSLVCPECSAEVTANNPFILYGKALIRDGASVTGSAVCPSCKKEVKYGDWVEISG